jgi:ketosteroid isomerase-like protein
MSVHAATPDSLGPRRAPTSEEVPLLDRLLAYEEIRQLAARYALAMDSRDFECLAGLFVEDYRHWDGRTGRAPLREEFDRIFGATPGWVGFTQVGGHVINLLDADHAHGTLHCSAELGDRGHWVRQKIVYEDVYERRDGTWYFVSREHHLFYGADAGDRPLDQQPAEWPKNIVGVGTAPGVWPTWRSFANGG